MIDVASTALLSFCPSFDLYTGVAAGPAVIARCVIPLPVLHATSSTRALTKAATSYGATSSNCQTLLATSSNCQILLATSPNAWPARAWRHRAPPCAAPVCWAAAKCSPRYNDLKKTHVHFYYPSPADIASTVQLFTLDPTDSRNEQL